MNWLVFALAAYGMLVLEAGFSSVVFIGDISFLLILLVYVGLMAPAPAAVWSSLVIGLMMDLRPGMTEHIIAGPYALGAMTGMYALLQLRGLVFRQSVFTITVMVFAVGIFLQIIVVTLYAMRGTAFITNEPVPDFNAADQLAHRFVDLIYTAIAAVPVGFVLLRSSPIFSFPGLTRAERKYR